jgi:hypothetical protein
MCPNARLEHDGAKIKAQVCLISDPDGIGGRSAEEFEASDW